MEVTEQCTWRARVNSNFGTGTLANCHVTNVSNVLAHSGFHSFKLSLARPLLTQHLNMSLAEEADARKLRLLALRRKKEGVNGEGQHSSEPILSRRNFDPQSRTLRKRTQDDDENMEDTVERDVAGLADQIVAEDEETRAQDLDLTNIAPKRPNWDLKRELDRKMAKLERKTQEAIHTLIRQRLAAQKGDTDDIIGAMRAQENAETNDNSSDEES